MKIYGEIIDNLDENRKPIYEPKRSLLEYKMLKEWGEDVKEEDCYNRKVFAKGEHREYKFTVYQDGDYCFNRIPQFIDIDFPKDQYSWAHKRLTREEKDLVNEFLKNVLGSAMGNEQYVFVESKHIRFIDHCTCEYPTTQELIQKAEEVIDLLADYWKMMYAE